MERRMAAGSIKKYAYIDAMRGLAFLAVLAFHATQIVPGVGGLASKIASQGFEGVMLFFVVSSLTMFLSLDSRRRERRPTLNFFIRRFFRIAPLFYSAGLFYATYTHYSAGRPAPSVRGIVLTALFLHGWSVEWINRLVPGGWTIGVEMGFYLLVPLLHRLIRTPERAAWAAAGGLIFAMASALVARPALLKLLGSGQLGEINNFLYYWLPMQFPIFCCGFCLYFLVRPGARSAGSVGSARRLSWLLMMAFAYLIAALTMSEARLFLGHALYGLAFILLGWSLALHPNRLLVNPVTCRIGVLSFSAYLTHFLAQEWVRDGLSRFAPGFEALPAIARLAIHLVLTLLLTLGFSAITYRFIELPGQAIGRRIIEALERSGGPSKSEDSPPREPLPRDADGEAMARPEASAI